MSDQPATRNHPAENLSDEGNSQITNLELPEFSQTDYDPPPATIAALEFQVASLLNDRYATVNWRKRDPIVVNRPGDWAKKQRLLVRIAKSMFPKRGDREDVLSKTILEYGLFRWANPKGFWTAFRHDMFDAGKAAFEATSAPIEKPRRTGSQQEQYEWSPSSESLGLDGRTARAWFAREGSEASVHERWQRVLTSNDPLDSLICEALGRIQGDESYMEELADSKGDTAKLSRLVDEIRSLKSCSQAEAYRLLNRFKKRHLRSADKKSAGDNNS